MVKKVIAVGVDCWESQFAKMIIESAPLNDIELEFWSVGSFVYKNMKYRDGVTKNHNGILYRYLNSIGAIFWALLRFVRKNVVFLFGGTVKGRKIHVIQILIKILGGRYVDSFIAGGMGEPERYKTLPDRRLIDLFPPEAVFISNISYKALVPSKRACKTWNIVETCALNYESFLENERKENIRPIEKKYVVFLDENLPFHPEPRLANTVWVNDVEQYFKGLNRLFGIIEKSFADGEVEVVIAAHPSAKFNTEKYDFGDRKLIFGDTVNLVKHSEFAIAYGCTSIDFAILYDKPVLYYTSDDLDTANIKSAKGKNAKSYKDYFEPTCVRIDRLENEIQIGNYLSYNEEKYVTYRENYLYSKEAKGRTHYEIIMDYILERG